MVISTPSPEIAAWQTSKDGIDFHSIDINNVNYIEMENPKSPVLVISEATFNDKLYYRLIMWNTIGKGVSNTVYLNVTGSMTHYNQGPAKFFKQHIIFFFIEESSLYVLRKFDIKIKYYI